MERLIFLYVSDGAAKEEEAEKFWAGPKVETRNRFATSVEQEGYYAVLSMLRSRGVVKDVVIVVESTRSPGSRKTKEGIRIYTVPHISIFNQFMKPNDIIWVRGGWRSWHKWLLGNVGKRWQMVYAANTGREKWKFWDVNLNDLCSQNYMDPHNRYQYKYIKPINPGVFKYLGYKLEYDIQICASRITHRKGQHYTLEAMVALKKMGYNARAYMPGNFPSLGYRQKCLDLISKHKLNVELPGMVSRKVICTKMNQSRIFTHLGGGGQGDRSPLEAAQCGCPILIASPHRHADYVTNPVLSPVGVANINDPLETAHRSKFVIDEFSHDDRKRIHNKFQVLGGIDRAFENMADLIDLMQQFKRPDPKRLIQRFGNKSL